MHWTAQKKPFVSVTVRTAIWRTAESAGVIDRAPDPYRQLIFPVQKLCRDRETVGNDHIVRLSDPFPVQNDLRNRVNPLKDQLKRFSRLKGRRGKYGPVLPVHKLIRAQSIGITPPVRIGYDACTEQIAKHIARHLCGNRAAGSICGIPE